MIYGLSGFVAEAAMMVSVIFFDMMLVCAGNCVNYCCLVCYILMEGRALSIVRLGTLGLVDLALRTEPATH